MIITYVDVVVPHVSHAYSYTTLVVLLCYDYIYNYKIFYITNLKSMVKKCELYIWVAQYENVSKKIVYTEGVAAIDAIIL